MPRYKFPLNKALILLTMSDVFSWGGYMALSTIVGLYLAQKLGMNVVEVVGIGSGIYLMTRALSQIPIGILTDRIKRDRDEIALLLLGSILMGGGFLLYPFLDRFELYWATQFIFGLGTSLNLVTWRKLFAKNLDLDREGAQYAVYDTVNSLAAAFFSVLAGVLGGISAIYFDYVVFGFGLLIMFGGFVGALLYFNKQRKTA